MKTGGASTARFHGYRVDEDRRENGRCQHRPYDSNGGDPMAGMRSMSSPGRALGGERVVGAAATNAPLAFNELTAHPLDPKGRDSHSRSDGVHSLLSFEQWTSLLPTR